MKTFNELRTINVSDHIDKKNGMSYLSWTYAVDTLLQADPTATWEFLPHLEINDTIMVRCQVHAFEKTMFMQLAVFDFKNQAIKTPNAVQVSNSMMRCLVKCIACFGIGLYIYAGEDLPEDKGYDPEAERIRSEYPSTEYTVPFGSFKNRTLDECFGVFGQPKIESAIYLTEQRIKENKPYAGVTIQEMQEFIDNATDIIVRFENQNIK